MRCSNLLADVHAESTAGMPIECKHEHLLTRLPQIDNRSNRRTDLGMGRSAAAFQGSVEFTQVPTGVGQVVGRHWQLVLLVFRCIAILPSEPESLVGGTKRFAEQSPVPA